MGEAPPTAPPKPEPKMSGLAAGNASAFGSACAVVIILIYHAKGIDFPAGMEAALGCIFSTLTVYARAFIVRFTGVSI